MKKRRLRIDWTCSDHAGHVHRWRWSAWLCGRMQWWLFGMCDEGEKQRYADAVALLRDLEGKEARDAQDEKG